MLLEEEMRELKSIGDKMEGLPSAAGKFDGETMRSVFEDRTFNSMSVQTVCEKYNLTPHQVAGIVRKMMNRMPLDSIGTIRKMELARIDFMLEKVWEKVRDGNLNAIQAASNLMRLRADYVPYLRADTKTQTGEEFEQISQALGISPEEVKELIRAAQGVNDFGPGDSAEDPA